MESEPIETFILFTELVEPLSVSHLFSHYIFYTFQFISSIFLFLVSLFTIKKQRRPPEISSYLYKPIIWVRGLQTLTPKLTLGLFTCYTILKSCKDFISMSSLFYF